jgi:hypothetical protein
MCRESSMVSTIMFQLFIHAIWTFKLAASKDRKTIEQSVSPSEKIDQFHRSNY